MKFHCPICDQRIEADGSYYGKSVDCPSCGTLIQVPTPEPKGVVPKPLESIHAPSKAPATKGTQETVPPKSRMSKVKVSIGVIALLAICFRLFCGIFVIQPIGAIPDGATIVYFRGDMDIPFIASADGIQKDRTGGVSLLGRGLILGAMADELMDRKIVKLPYMNFLYLWSTGGEEYDR